MATVTLRALNGVSQLVLMCASTPEAVRNCSSAMSSRSATALESCGCTSMMSESVNQRIRSISCTARSITTPTFDMRGGNGPTRVIAIERISSSRIASLIASTAGLKRSTWPTIKRHAGAARRGDNFAPLFDRRGDRLFHHDVDAARDAGKRDIAMQMGRRGNGDGVDVAIEQVADIGDGRAAQRARDEFGLLAVGIGDADEFGAGQSGEDAGMIAAHDADADDADAQRTLRACCLHLRHVSMVSPTPQTPALIP